MLLAIGALTLVAAPAQASPPTGAPGQSPPVFTTAPSISGSPASGSTLTANAGTWSGSNVSVSGYQWQRCDSSGANCSAVSGATQSSYLVGSADVGATLRVGVVSQNKNGSTSATSSATAVVTLAVTPPPVTTTTTTTTPPPTAPPTNSAVPQISGVAQAAQTLTASTGSWSGSPTSYAYRWNRCDLQGANCAAISGAAAQTYALVTADVGSTTRIAVTATNSGGNATAVSGATAVVTAVTVSAPVNTASPTIAGTPAVGQTLTASTGTWTGSPTAYAYQWKDCDTSGGNCTNVGAGSNAAYAAASADAGKTLRVAVTASSSAGSAVTVSGATTVVAAGSTTQSQFGFAAGGSIQNLSATDLARYLDALKAAHSGWLRFDINWQSIQGAGPTSYNWGPFDNVVNAAHARGIALLGSILYTPAWARAAGTNGSYPPTNLADYATFAKAAAQHFGPLGVHAYEIWNEPNIGFWQPSPDPVRYTSMLKLAYSAIKQVNSSATVISAGLSPYGSYGQSDSGHMNPINFLQQMYAAGAQTSMDAVGWHPYNYPYGLTFNTWSAWSQMAATSPSARSIMVANGDGAKQLWLTEFGEPTGTNTRAVSEATQAQFVTDAYTALKAWSWAGPAFLYSFRDVGTDTTNVENMFGVMRNDWSLKPAYSAFAAAAG